jgi:hypothetical protein
MRDPLPPLIAALLDPARYPEPATFVDLVETHASWLLLAGEFAYKIKKAITLPFLDYGTLARRHHFCETELRLNRRFAPELYLAVIPITGSADNPAFNGAGPVIEYAVKMRRFAEGDRLDHLCARDQLGPRLISSLAAAIVRFHDAATVALPASRFGEPAEVLSPMLANFTELPMLLPGREPRLARLAVWARDEFARLAPHFAARKAAGRVRECHGDLHLRNLVRVDERVMFFDCIEFSEELRWIDVASEIAFTYVDLRRQRRPSLAGWLLNEWLAGSGDYDATRVLRYYAVYRALVLAKVAAIRTRQTGGRLCRADDSLQLAESLITSRTKRLIITHGVAGCGKSRAARRLLLSDQTANTLCLRSDVERKRLYGLAAMADSDSPTDGGIYSRDASERTYRHLLALSETLLAADWSVIVDAAFLERSQRMAFRELAARLGVTFFIVAPQASPARLRARIRGRLAAGRDASEATLEVLRRQLLRMEPLDADERHALLVGLAPPSRRRGEGV